MCFNVTKAHSFSGGLKVPKMEKVSIFDVTAKEVKADLQTLNSNFNLLSEKDVTHLVKFNVISKTFTSNILFSSLHEKYVTHLWQSNKISQKLYLNSSKNILFSKRYRCSDTNLFTCLQYKDKLKLYKVCCYINKQSTFIYTNTRC